jgi:hypothetical protein
MDQPDPCPDPDSQHWKDTLYLAYDDSDSRSLLTVTDTAGIHFHILGEET